VKQALQNSARSARTGLSNVKAQVRDDASKLTGNARQAASQLNQDAKNLARATVGAVKTNGKQVAKDASEQITQAISESKTASRVVGKAQAIGSGLKAGAKEVKAGAKEVKAGVGRMGDAFKGM
jgi:hypothetical protein